MKSSLFFTTKIPQYVTIKKDVPIQSGMGEKWQDEGDITMIYWMKHLPKVEIDETEYKPFIKNEWFRRNFMWFVYGLQILLVIGSMWSGIWRFADGLFELMVFGITFLIHELLHVLIVFSKGDLSLTHSGIFFWLNSDAKMTKTRFFSFVSTPFLVLTALPAIASLFVNGDLMYLLQFIAWINSIIAGADIINMVLILFKPRKAIFYRGFYKV